MLVYYSLLINIIIYYYCPVETKAQAAVTDTVKHRLEQLDDFEEVCVAMVIQYKALYNNVGICEGDA